MVVWKCPVRAIPEPADGHRSALGDCRSYGPQRFQALLRAGLGAATNTCDEDDSSIRSENSLHPTATGSWKRDARPASATSAASRAVARTRSTRRLSRADRTLSGSVIEPDIGGLDVPARTRASLAVAAAEPRAHRPCSYPGRATTELGPQHTGAGGFSGPRQALEPRHHLDYKSRKRVSSPAAGRDGRSSANAVQSAASREIELDEPAKSNHRERLRRTAHYRHRAGRSEYDVPAILQSCLHLGPASLLSVRELVLPTVLWRRVLRIWTWDQHGILFRRRLGWLGRIWLGSGLGQPQRLRQQ